MNGLARDVRDARRGLFHDRSFTAAAVIMLALGVAASTTIFAAIRAVVFELPFADPDRVVTIRARTADGESLRISREQFETWQQATDVFESIAAYTLVSPVMTGDAAAQRLQAEAMTASMFSVLGVQPRLGRTFRDDDGAVVVLSDAFWRSRFDADPEVLGRTILLDAVPTLVIGVMPPGFDGPRSRPGDVWLPFHAARSADASRPASVSVLARLAPRITPAAAGSRLEAFQSFGSSRWTASVETARQDFLYQDALSSIRILASGASLLMLMACVNVASLILGRNVTRRREMAVRLALGATRLEIVRYVALETLLVSCTGALAGLLAAWWVISAMVPTIPRWFPRIAQINVDWAVASFAAVVAVSAALLVSVWPAWSAAGEDAGVVLKAGARRTSQAPQRVRTTLVVIEATLAMVVMTIAAMLIGSFGRLNPTNPGFEYSDRTKFSVRFSGPRYQDRASRIVAVDEIVARLRAIPGVVDVSSVTQLPLTGTSTVFPVRVSRGVQPARQPTVHFRAALPNYLPSMGMPVIRGRGLTPADTAQSQAVTVVNEALVARMLKGNDPLESELVVDEPEGPVVRRIVGVVRDARASGNDLRSWPEMFVPYAQAPLTLASFVVRFTPGAPDVGVGISQSIRSFDAGLPVDRLETLRSVVERSVDVQRFYAMLMGAFAAAAVVLTFLGLYSVAAWSVSQRTREIGVRLAVGASPRHIRRLVLRYGAGVGITGAVVGVACAAASAKVIESYLYGFPARQPGLFAVLGVVLIAIVTFAAYVPARRAMRIDPMVALRSD